jgi:CRP-like cAMP-binding protein
MYVPQASAGNALIRGMDPADFALLQPYLLRIPLPAELKLHEAGRAIDRVYFPEDGVVSIVAATLDGKLCEVGLFGREGMSETATVLGTDRSPHEAFVQVAGVSTLQLAECFERSSTLRQHLLRYVQAMMVQLPSSIAAAGQTVDQRLARWLLMCHDRVDGDTINVTHEFIGMMLNVRRAGVTVALQAASDAGLIVRHRGTIEIWDRDGLRRLAGGSYGLAEAEYQRLIGVPLCKPSREPFVVN